MTHDDLDFLSGGGAMARRIADLDWSCNPLGPPDGWPEVLRTAVSTILTSKFPQALIWGPDLITFHNDAFVPILGDKPSALGRPFSTVWSEAWEEIGLICAAVFDGHATFIEDYPLIVDRGSGPEQAYFTFCYSPIRDGAGRVVGMLDTVMETTGTVIGLADRRRLAFLDALARAIQAETDPNTILAITTRMTAEHLNASNCAYADMDADRNGFTIRGDWAAPGSPSIVGHYSLADFGALAVANLSAGKPLVINDNLAELAPDEAATFQAIGITATICMPLVKEGRLTGLMAIHDNAPRKWSAYDLSVIEEVTERSWAHVERVRSEDNLRRAQEAGGVGLFAIDIDANMIQGTAEFCRLFGLELCDQLSADIVEALVIDDDRPVVSTRARRRSGDAPLDVEYRIRRADTGEIRSIARKAEYERDATGRPVRLVGAVRDVTEQRAAQQALQQSEVQFRMLAEAMPNMAWTAPPSGELDWFNEQVYTYCGMQPGELSNNRWVSIVHPDDLGTTMERWREALASGSTYQSEFRLRRADGAYRWHLVRAVPIRDAGGYIYRWIGTNTDIHERMLSEVATIRDRERLWVTSQDLLIVCDAAGGIIDINPTATRLLGWNSDEMIGKSILDFIHPADRAASENEVAKVVAGRATLSFENRYLTKSGDYLLLDWTGVPDGNRIHGVGRDITDSRAVAREQERIWTLSPVLKIVATPDGVLKKVNPAWVRTLGWSAGASIGQHFIDHIDAADREKASAVIAGLVVGEVTGEMEWSFHASDGGQRQIAWSFAAENQSLFGFGRDVTEQRGVEEALRQSQKMEAVGQLTGGIAHDFNNLLQGITGNLELLQHRIEQGRPEDIERFIKSASTSASRASALTHRLLAFSRRQPLDPRPVRANMLVSSMEDMLRRTLGETIALDLVLADGLWLTKCDPNQLESAILNLVINARDAMPSGGTLSIETCNAHLDTAYAARQREVAPGQYVCICVCDSGIGMDSETISRAFEPFFTTKPIGQGTGLGLSMIYGFARQSEGYAKIDSELDKGTTIKLYLPRHRGDTPADEDLPHLTVDHITDSGETVLVVEDEPVVRGLIVEVLSELGYRVIEAVDGPSGLQILQSTRRIDLLVTDIGLPGLNGRQVADAARVSRPDLKILFMTGYAENAALASGFLEPGMAMITKPFAIEVLASRIREMIEA